VPTEAHSNLELARTLTWQVWGKMCIAMFLIRPNGSGGSMFV